MSLLAETVLRPCPHGTLVETTADVVEVLPPPPRPEEAGCSLELWRIGDRPRLHGEGAYHVVFLGHVRSAFEAWLLAAESGPGAYRVTRPDGANVLTVEV